MECFESGKSGHEENFAKLVEDYVSRAHDELSQGELRGAASLAITAADACARVDAAVRESVMAVLTEVMTRLEEAGEVELSVLVGSRIASCAGMAAHDAESSSAVDSSAATAGTDESRGDTASSPTPASAVVVEGDDAAALDEAMAAMSRALSAAVEGSQPSAPEGEDDPLAAIARAFENAFAGGSREEGEGPLAALARAVDESGVKVAEAVEVLNYRTLAGYDSIIRSMRDIGIGMQEDEKFRELVTLLNTRHGVDRMPVLDTLLFRAPAREDANRFVAATVGELGLPVVRMHMEESLQGLPLLCVTARTEDSAKPGSLREMFDAGGVLVLEDVDLWSAPLAETAEEAGNVLLMQLTRGAREAVGLIRSAVDSPDVYVLATASSAAEVDGFFLDMLEPLSVIDIDYPTPEERVDIWLDIAREHPSLRGVNRADLVRYSANMPRYDMYMAAREAVEEAYKLGLVTRKYQPVTRDNIFDKLAAYQPLDSREYHELEEAVVRDFRRDLSHIDDLLRGE